MTFPVHNPATGEVLAEVPVAPVADFDRAVAAARAAFDDGPWPRMSAGERAAALNRLADALATRRDPLVDTVIDETGCPRRLTEPAQVGAAIDDVRRYAALGVGLRDWEYTDVPLAGHFAGPGALRMSIRHWEPVGVVAALTPYNFPLFTSVTKVVPALVAGCTVVLRPSPLAPLGVLALADAAAAADLPPGVLSVLTEDVAAGAHRLTTHEGVDLVSFTGSTAVGRAIAAQAGATVKRLVLELGGKSVQLYLPDAVRDGVDGPVRGATTVWLNHAGQACSAQTRMLVPHAAKPAVLDALRDAAARVRIGDPRSADTQLGPLISAAHRDGCLRWIGKAVDSGARLVTGGEVPDGFDRGWYLAPTVLDIDDNRNPAAQAEIFGPCLTVQGYADVDEAVRIANDSDYGLAGAVYTGDLDAGLAVAKRIRSGTVNVNTGWPDAYTPFGGIKQSGYGVERSASGIRQYQYGKHIAIASP